MIPMPRIPESAANAAATVAIGLLLAVLAGRMVLISSAMPPLRAQALLHPAPSTIRDPARLVLVVDPADSARSARAARRVRQSHPGQRLAVQPLSWEAPLGRRTRDARTRALIRAYGYSELPVLLTVSRDGQVVRVQSFPIE